MFIIIYIIYFVFEHNAKVVYKIQSYPLSISPISPIFNRQKIGIGVEKGFICLNLKWRGTFSVLRHVYNEKPLFN